MARINITSVAIGTNSVLLTEFQNIDAKGLREDLFKVIIRILHLFKENLFK